MQKVIKAILICLETFIVLTILSENGFAQSNPLEKRISIAVSNEPLEKVLNKISQTIDANFSFNSSIVPLDSLVSLSVKNKPVSKIMYILLGRNYYFKTIGRHIIILKKNNAKIENSPKTSCTFKGHINNLSTGQGIPGATIYDLNKNFSALTDSNGFYKFSILPETEFISLCFSKSNFNDTVVILKSIEAKTIDIGLNPKPAPKQKIEKLQPKGLREVSLFDINDYRIVQTFVEEDMLIHAKNLDLQEKRIGQISFLPFVGTNRRVSGAIVNRLSFNILAGYSYGVYGVEIGGLLNISKKDVNGVQFSGFGNITGGHTKGFQAAGFFNRNGGSVNGFQVSGFSNIVLDTLKGVQIGFFNYVKTNKGLQLGFINTADSSSGVSFGFMSIVKNGYYNLCLFTDEMLMGNLSFKMGTPKFYNIWGLSASKEMWGLTYGFGMHPHPEKIVSLNYDLSFTNMSYKKKFEPQVCLKTKIEADLNIRLYKKFDVFTGVSYNVFTSDTSDVNLQTYITQLSKTDIKASSFKSVTLQFWPGLVFGFKLKL